MSEIAPMSTRIDPSILEEYQAVREAVGFLRLPDRGKVEVTGADRVTFLHAMITNDVQDLNEWAGRYGALLTHRGKIVSDFFYYRLPQCLLMDLQTDRLSKTVEMLEKHIIMDEVFLKDVSEDWEQLSFQGPLSDNLTLELFRQPGPADQYQVQEVAWEGQGLFLIRKAELARSGYEVWVPKGVAAAFEAYFRGEGRRFGLRQVGREAHEILRLEAGIPWYGIDMDEQRYPMEARLDEAVSLTKGCYIGQEVVAKATHIGGVSNLLMGWKLEGEIVPPKGSSVHAADGKQIGTVTSATFSPYFQAPIGFAYLKRSFARPGETYTIKVNEEKFIPAKVIDRFRSPAHR